MIQQGLGGVEKLTTCTDRICPPQLQLKAKTNGREVAQGSKSVCFKDYPRKLFIQKMFKREQPFAEFTQSVRTLTVDLACLNKCLLCHKFKLSCSESFQIPELIQS